MKFGELRAKIAARADSASPGEGAAGCRGARDRRRSGPRTTGAPVATTTKAKKKARGTDFFGW